MNHGVYTSEQGTSVSSPVAATCGIPYVVGTAPIQSAESPAAANTPVLCESWGQAVKYLGYSDDWESYTLCEFMYSHFKLFAVQPVIFCNVLDGAGTSSVSGQTLSVSDHIAKLPIEAVNDENLVVTNREDTLTAETDYTVYYSGEYLCIELLEDGSYYDADELTVDYQAVEPGSVTATEIAEGLEGIELCATGLRILPDLICAPGWSQDSTVAALMAAKAGSFCGMFTGKALIDIDTGTVTNYADCETYKADNGLTDENEILCWPMAQYGSRIFHLSTQVAGLMAQVDAGNGCPYESPSNKSLVMDGAVLEDGTSVLLTLTQANYLNGLGIVTALNSLASGWVCWGDWTACYPDNTEAKDYFIPVSRMFDWVKSSLVQTFWAKVDKPMNRRLLDTIVDTCNIWMNGLVANEYLLGGRVEMLDDENPAENLMAGIVKLHIYMTPANPAQEIDFVLEYDPDYVTSALSDSE